MMDVITILLIIMVFYSFFGYPILLFILGLLIDKPIRKKERRDFKVSIVIAAYNEENVIAQKIENTLGLSYPPEKMEIIVCSDGSTDNTDAIVKKYADRGIILHRVEGRKGKTEAQNQTVNITSGDIIIFSDANAFYYRNAIEKIVRNFNDESVGGVCGQLRYVRNTNSPKNTESAYWSFEKFLKETESKIGSVLGANGSIYAIRKDLYIPLKSDLISDFVEPLKIIEQGFRVIYEKEAISEEKIESIDNGLKAFKRKVRINNRAIRGMFHTLELLNIKQYGLISISLFSHKILRYLMPFILLFIFIFNFTLLGSIEWRLIFAVQILFYSFSFIGSIYEKNEKNNVLFSYPWYFFWTHVAILFAWYEFVRGKKRVVWETQR